MRRPARRTSSFHRRFPGEKTACRPSTGIGLEKEDELVGRWSKRAEVAFSWDDLYHKSFEQI